jgi:hypothetical protein
MFAVDLLLGILVFGYIIVRQVRSRPVRSFNPRVPLILGVIGVVELVSFVRPITTRPPSWPPWPAAWCSRR